MKHQSSKPDIIGEHEFGMEANTMFAEFHMDVSQMKLKKKGLYFIVLEYKVGAQRNWRKATQIPVLVNNKILLQQKIDLDGQQEIDLDETEKQEKENQEN
ncbi:MAG: hypothetical protein OEL83_19850 [Desulforhopalus sp.]|nr:hypothetical protein [Desulforhopalus sp.]